MTIAYSDKYNMWTTRYSFEPNCYGTVGNTMISSKGGGIWKHDVNDSRCSFYGLAQGCSLEVASNRDPSAIKSFNSISLETNSSDWQATVFTNDEYSSASQEAPVGNFISKEGFQYAAILRDTKNSTKNISSLGQAYSSIDVGGDANIITVTLNFNSSIPPNIPHTGSPISVNISDTWILVKKLESGPQGSLQLRDVIEGQQMFAVGLGDRSLTVQFQNNNYANDGDIEAIFFPNQTPLVLAVQSNSALNGDKMRGPYARVSLNTSTTEPIELHAINLDYSLSHLDASLSQNVTKKKQPAQQPRSNSRLSQNR